MTPIDSFRLRHGPTGDYEGASTRDDTQGACALPGWIGSLGAGQLDNWDICVREGLFGSGARASGGVQRGDDLFIWLAKEGLKAHCVATADAQSVDGSTSLPWPPKSEGSYRAVIPIEVVAEVAEPIDRRWDDVKRLAQINSSPQFFPKVTGPGLDALRALFGAQMVGKADYFFPGPDVEWLGQDHRHMANRAITYRRGQRRFRDGLFRAYDGRCAITGSSVAAVLEAAHISPFRGDHTNRVDNGLLLRADIHTLFDLDLLTVTPSMTVRVSGDLVGTEYSAYDSQPLRAPSAAHDRPGAAVLSVHNERCRWLSPSL